MPDQDPFRISADEINYLIYAYFRDSGFSHSAFVLRVESKLERSTFYGKSVPRGELVELLGKALLYSEVEAHWRGNNMTLSCTSKFGLLEPHICSYDPQLPPPPPPPPPPLASQRVPFANVQPQAHALGSASASSESSLKRKASGTSSSEDHPPEKKTRMDGIRDGGLELRSTSSVEPRPSASRASSSAPEHTNSASDLVMMKSNGTATLSDSEEHPDGPVRLLRGHKAEVFVCAWNPVNHAALASGSKDSLVHIWNVPGPDADGNVLSSVDPPIVCAYAAKGDDRDLTTITWSPDGTLVAVGCYDCVLRICDAQGKGYFMQQQQEGPIFAVQFSPSGRWLLSASLDGSACLWDVKEKRLHEQYRLHKEACCLDVDWLSDTQFVTSGSDGVINIMRMDDSKPLRRLVGHEHEVNQVKCNPSRTRIASCSDDMTGRIWDITDVNSTRTADEHPIVLSGHTGPVSHIAWAPITISGEHDLVATSSFDGTSRLWDSITGECLCTFHDHKSNVYALAFSPDGRHIATGGADGWLYIYDVMAKEKRWSYYAGASQPSIFEIVWQQSGDLNRIAMAMERRTVGVVDLTRIPEMQ